MSPSVISAFLRNLGITPAGEILIDRIDSVRDIRTIAGLEDTVRKKVKHCLITNKITGKVISKEIYNNTPCIMPFEMMCVVVANSPALGFAPGNYFIRYGW